MTTTYYPVSFTVPQYVDSNGDPYSGAVLKAYSAGTSTNVNVSSDYQGSATATSVALNAAGNPAISGTVIIPHYAENIKLSLYPTQAAADANTGAIWTVDNIQITSGANSAGVLTNVASATTTVLNSTITNYLNITGTTTITTLTLSEGSEVICKFAGALTLTNSSSLVCLGGSNITTAAGDIARFRGEASGVVRMLSYMKANGTILSGSATSGQFPKADGSGGTTWGSPALTNTGYKTNYYYNTVGINVFDTSTGFAVTANRLYCMPFIVGSSATFTRIGIGIIGTTSSNARLGIYNMSSGLPTSLVLDAGTVSTSSAGSKEITISKALTPGFYALACVFDATPSTYRGNNSSTMDINNFLNFLNGSASAASQAAFAFYMAHTYGALPDPFVFGTAIADPTASPMMWLRVV